MSLLGILWIMAKCKGLPCNDKLEVGTLHCLEGVGCIPFDLEAITIDKGNPTPVLPGQGMDYSFITRWTDLCLCECVMISNPGFC